MYPGTQHFVVCLQGRNSTHRDSVPVALSALEARHAPNGLPDSPHQRLRGQRKLAAIAEYCTEYPEDTQTSGPFLPC
jgi:hypothetical protein